MKLDHKDKESSKKGHAVSINYTASKGINMDHTKT